MPRRTEKVIPNPDGPHPLAYMEFTAHLFDAVHKGIEAHVAPEVLHYMLPKTRDLTQFLIYNKLELYFDGQSYVIKENDIEYIESTAPKLVLSFVAGDPRRSVGVLE